VLDTLKVAISAVQKEAEKLQGASGAKKSDIGGILANASNALLTAMVVLFKTAGQAQQELIQRGKTNARMDVYRKDPAWAQGLMSTVSEVVSASSFLVACTQRCASVDTQGLESAVEDLSKAAKNVSAGASRVVAASKAKSDARSAALAKMSNAGQSVNEATKALIEAAKRAAVSAREKAALAAKEPYSFEARTKTGELKAQLEIARLERELERSKAAAKAQADMAEGWTERKGATSAIDAKLKEKKKQQAAQEEDTNSKLRREAAAAREQAQKKIAKLAPDVPVRKPTMAQPSKPAKKAQRQQQEEEEEEEEEEDLAPPPRPDESDEDEDAPAPPPHENDEDQDEDDDAATAAAFLAAKKKAARK